MINTIEKAKLTLLNAENGKPVYINWFEEGGGEVFRLNYDWYVLFRVSQYSGDSYFIGTYHYDNIDMLLKEAFSWT